MTHTVITTSLNIDGYKIQAEWQAAPEETSLQFQRHLTVEAECHLLEHPVDDGVGVAVLVDERLVVELGG